MDRKMLLLILCVGAAVVSGVLVIHKLSLYTPSIVAIETSIEEINANRSAWVNRIVVVEGKLCGPSVHIPESVPPWNYELFGPDEKIETLGKPETVAIGVLWKGSDDYHFENTTVVGVVKKGHWGYLWGEQPTCYYIEAKEINRW